ncbi:long-chain-fatty-acid--CoA ligase [Caulobacter sp. HMWF025]|uniref:long-chain-fatty-acid--CoA ligase n=3 Tax=unclassified Caulobacter TaxID=2648921 RepID=UPI000D3B5EEA|nr:long-chain-fatty-acid--CoA ligase [Caulobacter sp. HMWF025]PTT10549.1 fatty-acid--CoA ligase [Caulobacter sp. HMWF025]
MFGLTEMLNSAARGGPNSPSTTFNTTTRTWSQTQARVARLAGGLGAMGVQRGDRVAILALNSDRYTEFLSAVWWAGAVVVPMNIRWTAEENAYSLRDSGTRVLFVDRAFASVAAACRAMCPDLEQVVWSDDGPAPEGLRHYEDLITAHDPAPDAGAGGEDLAGLYYTGGTTGFPKGVMLPHRALWYNNLVCAMLLGVGPDDVVLHAAPMFHMADSCLGGGASIMGATHAYVPRFDAEAVMAAIETRAVTHTVMVPTMIAMLLQHPAFDTERLRSLRAIGYGGSSISRGVLAEALVKLPHVRFVQIYGQTEMAPVITALPPGDHVLEGPRAVRLASAGRPAPGCEVRIVDEAGVDAAPGEVGEIIARSPGVMHGYWNQPEQTATTIRDGWVHTGDGGYQDPDGYIFIVDRLKDMIVTGGENVFSAEVESAISTHPAVAQVAVIGVPCPRWGEQVHAIVVPRPGHAPTQDEVLAHCEPLLANYKRPRGVTFRIEALPLSGAGKVLKRELRAPFWDGQTRNVN